MAKFNKTMNYLEGIVEATKSSYGKSSGYYRNAMLRAEAYRKGGERKLAEYDTKMSRKGYKNIKEK